MVVHLNQGSKVMVNLIYVTCIMLTQLFAALVYIMYRQGRLIMFHIYVDSDLVPGLHFYVPLHQNPKQPSNFTYRCTNESRRVVKADKARGMLYNSVSRSGIVNGLLIGSGKTYE